MKFAERIFWVIFCWITQYEKNFKIASFITKTLRFEVWICFHFISSQKSKFSERSWDVSEQIFSDLDSPKKNQIFFPKKLDKVRLCWKFFELIFLYFLQIIEFVIRLFTPFKIFSLIQFVFCQKMLKAKHHFCQRRNFWRYSCLESPTFQNSKKSFPIRRKIDIYSLLYFETMWVLKKKSTENVSLKRFILFCQNTRKILDFS